MNWKYKALLQSAFSAVPFGESLNYSFQKHVTRRMPVSQAEFDSKVARVKTHIDALRAHGKHPIEAATFYEFGAGWDMIVPLGFYAYGVERQIQIDIRRLLRRELIQNTLAQFQHAPDDLGLLRRPAPHLEPSHDLTVTLRKYGIEYDAPCDARNTGLASGSIHYITSSTTLEHVPAEDIRAILKECCRILRDDGMMSFRTDYQDHYSYFDGSVSPYNFLRFSEQEWARYSPSLHYQNRLRHRDYIEMFEEAGFEVVTERRQDGTPEDLAGIRQLPLDERFRSYSPEELTIRRAQVVMRKRCSVETLASRSDRGSLSEGQVCRASS